MKFQTPPCHLKYHFSTSHTTLLLPIPPYFVWSHPATSNTNYTHTTLLFEIQVYAGFSDFDPFSTCFYEELTIKILLITFVIIVHRLRSPKATHPLSGVKTWSESFANQQRLKTMLSSSFLTHRYGQAAFLIQENIKQKEKYQWMETAMFSGLF